MKVIFMKPDEDGEEVDCLTVEITGDPENCTVEFSGEVGIQGLKQNLVKGQFHHNRIFDIDPDSNGVFNIHKLTHWKEAGIIWRTNYLCVRTEDAQANQ